MEGKFRELPSSEGLRNRILKSMRRAGYNSPDVMAEVSAVFEEIALAIPEYQVLSDGYILRETQKNTPEGNYYDLVAERIITFSIPGPSPLVDATDRVFEILDLIPLPWVRFRRHFKSYQTSAPLVCHGEMCYDAKSECGFFTPCLRFGARKIYEKIPAFSKVYPEGSVFAGIPRNT